MDILNYLWDADQVLITIGSYPLSFLELAGTLTGLVSVWYASRASILTWPTGILNEFFFFLLFYQVQLYSDMFLQLVFFGVSVHGWLHWKKGAEHQLPVSALSEGKKRKYVLILVLGMLGLGWLMQDIHVFLPSVFPKAAAYPFGDAFTTVASIIAIFLQARKKIESWYFWIAVDLVAIYLYLQRGIYFIAAEFFVFLLLCLYGYWHWRKQIRLIHA